MSSTYRPPFKRSRVVGTGSGRAARADLFASFTHRTQPDAVGALMDDYVAQLTQSCGGGAQAAAPTVMDNTAHVASCSLAATPVIIGLLAVFWLLRCLICPQQLRTTYSGSEDAPELETVCSGDGGTTRRVESYSIRAGRLTSSPSLHDAPRPKAKGRKTSQRDIELEPVLHRS